MFSVLSSYVVSFLDQTFGVLSLHYELVVTT